MLQIFDMRMAFPSPSLNVVIDYFCRHSCLKMCKICLKRTLDVVSLGCLALTFWNGIVSHSRGRGGGGNISPDAKLVDISVSRLRKKIHLCHQDLKSMTGLAKLSVILSCLHI